MHLPLSAKTGGGLFFVHRSFRFSDAGRRFRRRSSRRAEPRLGFGPCPEHGPTFPHSVRCIERVILSFGTYEKVKLYKARHLVEMTVARKPDPREGLATQKRFLACSTSNRHRSAAMTRWIPTPTFEGGEGASQARADDELCVPEMRPGRASAPRHRAQWGGGAGIIHVGNNTRRPAQHSTSFAGGGQLRRGPDDVRSFGISDLSVVDFRLERTSGSLRQDGRLPKLKRPREVASGNT
jgi:hypothetical protein